MQITKAFGAELLDAGADLFHDLEVDAEKVVAAHARLAGTPAVTMQTSAPSIAE